MVLSDHIAELIEKMLEEGGGAAEVKRNDLASRLGCVPSQISYVITSRFTPEHGYSIESRRGGGGCIRIVRVRLDRNKYLMHFFQALGESLSENETKAYLRNLLEHEFITAREASMMARVTSAAALDHCAPEERGNVRADMMRQFIMMLMLEN